MSRLRCPFSNDASEGCKWRSPTMHYCSRRFYAGRIPIVPECAQRARKAVEEESLVEKLGRL